MEARTEDPPLWADRVPVSVGSSVALELTLMLRSKHMYGPAKRHTTVSRKADSTKVQVITKVRASRHSPPATTRIVSGWYWWSSLLPSTKRASAAGCPIESGAS